ncbi:MAG: hypothetical protein J3Q66DRAFT_382609 [Benniella sp.]|nr:MAG: hypothetical protein J3Q66DRAFT_382609 [Benniella sp.]
MASTGMANQTMQPRNIVQSFLDTLSDNGQSHGVHRPSNGGGARQGLEPSLQELLDPSVALRTRLLRNPGLSNTARVTVLTANGARDSLHQDSLTLISERAMDGLVEAARAHFLQIEKAPLSSGSDRQVKARLIFQRLCDPSNPLTIPETIDNLQEYLKAFRSEALEVVGYLLDMATSASKEASHVEDATDTDWSDNKDSPFVLHFLQNKNPLCASSPPSFVLTFVHDSTAATNQPTNQLSTSKRTQQVLLLSMAWEGENGVDSWVKRLRENDPSFTSLHILSFCRVTLSGLGQVFDALKTNTTLQELYASGHAFDEAAAKILASTLEQNTTLERLNIGSDQLGVEDKILWDDDMESLNTPLTPEQEQQIRSDGDGVLETISAALKTNDTLQELWMDYCNISSVGAAFLADALRHNQSLITIRMRNNRIGNRGGRALGAALSTATSNGPNNTTLKNLELDSNKAGVLGWHGLAGANSLESLGLYENGTQVINVVENHRATPTGSSSSSTTTASVPAAPRTPSSASVVMDPSELERQPRGSIEVDQSADDDDNDDDENQRVFSSYIKKSKLPKSYTPKKLTPRLEDQVGDMVLIAGKEEDHAPLKAQVGSDDSSRTPSQSGSRPRPFHCTYDDCKKVFIDQIQLDRHLERHGPKELECGIDGCRKRFSAQMLLRRHQSMVHKRRSAVVPVHASTGMRYHKAALAAVAAGPLTPSTRPPNSQEGSALTPVSTSSRGPQPPSLTPSSRREGEESAHNSSDA